MNRRNFIKSGGALVGSLLLPNYVNALITKSASDLAKPNVLFMVVDDLNDWVGYLGGYPGVITPNMDRLAKESVIFTNAQCPAPLCNPSRTAFLSGLKPSTTGVYYNSQQMLKCDVLKNNITLPELFKLNQYHAAGAGKIFHSQAPQYWDEYWPSLTVNLPKDPEPENGHIDGYGFPNEPSEWGPLNVDDSAMGDSQVADWIDGYLNRKNNKAFFLACGFFRPHEPWRVPQKYFDMYPLDKIKTPQQLANDLDDVPRIGKRLAKTVYFQKHVDAHQWEKAVQSYLASITFADAQVGKVIDTLEKSEYANNTIVVFCSDNGWHLGEKFHWGKSTLWEEGTRVPLLIKIPGNPHPGERCNQAVNLLDLYPTLMELCKLKGNVKPEGSSITNLITNPKAKRTEPSLSTFGKGNHSLRTERWRYTRYFDGGEELYDHDKDPMEWTNLAGDKKYQKIIADLKKWLPKKDAEDSYYKTPTVGREIESYYETMEQP